MRPNRKIEAACPPLSAREEPRPAGFQPPRSGAPVVAKYLLIRYHLIKCSSPYT